MTSTADTGDMSDGGIHDEIARLEDRIETLIGERERCRKISLVARLLTAIGTVWVLLMLVTVVPFVPGTFFAAVAAALGGAVLMGSNKTTWEQTETALRESEAKRAELIGGVDLRVVGEDRPTLH